MGGRAGGGAGAGRGAGGGLSQLQRATLKKMKAEGASAAEIQAATARRLAGNKARTTGMTISATKSGTGTTINWKFGTGETGSVTTPKSGSSVKGFMNHMKKYGRPLEALDKYNL